MSILDKLADPAQWAQFAAYKEKKLPPGKWEELCRFIDQEAYRPVVDGIVAGKPFPAPVKMQISKMYSDKKRTVYLYPKSENYVLKLMTYLLIRKYDPIFAPGLYSFRASRGVKMAVLQLTSRPNARKKYIYKADIHDYFNSVDVSLLLPKLREVLREDPEIYRFLEGLLLQPMVFWNGVWIKEQKGIMAGCPVAAFLANVYLMDMDWQFARSGIPYCRYSDDIILLTDSPEDQERAVFSIRDHLARQHLTINEKKEMYTLPGEPWEFLGFRFENGEIDISGISAQKLKGKMRRKADALLRWKRKKGLSNEKAAKAFIKVFNRKLFDNPIDTEITWARWYFPMITTTRTLEQLDHYAQDCIRYIATEKRTKSRYNFRYEDMKAMGYRSLVHEYYRLKKETASAD